MTTFEVWAPIHDRVRLRTLGADHEMSRSGDGLWRATVPGAGPGTDYAFLLGDDDTPLPDPRSRWQPEGVHGPSRLTDPGAYEWGDGEWTGRQLAGSVVYELHIGTFAPGGTFAAAAEKLDHLAELGVDLVEVLPVNAVNGTHNWGYDGVGWYAVHEPYGGPDAFKAFVDACHRRGIGVLLDVVYNHLGPSGAYLPRFAPFFKQGRSTWGDLVNLDGPGSEPVRRYILDNALMWLHDYHVDGLRLDAVHALVDLGAKHLLEELATEVDALSTPPAPAAHADRRVRPERPAAGPVPGRRRVRADRAVGRRRAPRTALGADRRDPGLLLGLRLAVHAGQGVHRGVRARRRVFVLPRPGATGGGSTGRTPRPTGSSPSCRTTTRSATGRWVTGCPASRPRCRRSC